jgi:hypothetical protein
MAHFLNAALIGGPSCDINVAGVSIDILTSDIEAFDITGDNPEPAQWSGDTIVCDLAEGPSAKFTEVQNLHGAGFSFYNRLIFNRLHLRSNLDTIYKDRMGN